MISGECLMICHESVLHNRFVDRNQLVRQSVVHISSRLHNPPRRASVIGTMKIVRSLDESWMFFEN